MAITEAQRAANARSEKKNTVRVVLKLSKNTDADILAKLGSLDNRQGYIKRLIREDLKSENEITTAGVSPDDKKEISERI